MPRWRPRRLAAFIGLHLMFILLAANCAPDSIGHGTFYLAVPNSVYGQQDIREVEFFLDEPVGEGTFTGWVRGGGCEVWVTLCDRYYCEDIFYRHLNAGEEFGFEISSSESPVFEHYLERFVPCYKEGEFAAEPFSCQRWDCHDSRHDITIILESPCSATLQASIEVEYLDVRVPFLGLCVPWYFYEDTGECEDYSCEDLDSEF